MLAIASRYGVPVDPQETPISEDSQEVTGDLNRLSGPVPAESSDVQAEAVKLPAATPVKLTPEEQNKLEMFRSVIKSGNDNDPRVDKELKSLSPALKMALKQDYEKLPKEHRNGRGFIAFLIGRSISTAADVQFLEKVVNEEPCLSFKDCDAKGPMYEEAQEHSTEVSLNYPQIVATRMLKQSLPKAPPELRGKINEVVTSSRY